MGSPCLGSYGWDIQMTPLENLFDAHKIAWHRPQLTQAKPAGKPLVKAVNERKIFLFRKQFHERFSGLCPRKLRRSKRDDRKFRESLCVIAQALVKTPNGISMDLRRQLFNTAWPWLCSNIFRTLKIQYRSSWDIMGFLLKNGHI